MESNGVPSGADGRANGDRLAAILDPLRALKALVRHWYRSAELAARRPGTRYARGRSTRGHFPSRWVEVRTPIKRRPGPAGINENRLHNMELASRHLSGLVIRGGEAFRFWRHVPRATPRNGFRVGFSLVDGRLHLDHGGGLCQVATTLFQAFLQGDFDILERSNHSVDIHGEERFFNLGSDAAVAFGYKDLIVRNSTDVPIHLQAHVDRETMSYSVALDSSEPQRPPVRIQTEPLDGGGGDGSDGCATRVTTVRESLRNGEWVETYTSLDVYQPR